MSHKFGKKFHFSLDTVIRLIIFVIAIILVFNLLATGISTRKLTPAPKVLGDSIELQQLIDQAYQRLSPQSQATIDNLPSNPLIVNLKIKYSQVISQLAGFPGKQIDEIKRSLIQSIYDDLMKSAPSP